MSEPRTIQLPWQGLLALGATLVGVVWYLAPLDTSRPIEREGVSLKLQREQDVDARLWQDPLATAFAHDEQIRAIDKTKDPVTPLREELLHSPRALSDTINEVKARRDDLLVLPVFVSGGAYAEHREIRLRARRAVLEALGTNQLSPIDGEHIGYVRMRPFNLSSTRASLAQEESQWSNDNSAPPEYFILPYEWCGPAFALRQGKPRQVLILWVREEELGARPLGNLALLLRALDIQPGVVKVIGPRTSTALRAIVDEAAGVSSKTPGLSGMVILSPTATVSENVLLRGHENEEVGTVKALLKKKFDGVAFHRITLTDDTVCRELIVELGRRGVHLDLAGAPTDYRGGHDHVALISEWDTFYGRALPLSFAHEVSGLDYDILTEQYPTNIHAYQYLRGIDGMLPGASVPEQRSANGKKADTKTRPKETLEGLNQADYLRRLALLLKEENRRLIRDSGAPLKAVGVLGSDVFDKLLVLKALRPALPGVLFFTNNLDARFGHPDEWNSARNLIVVSPFGLRLRQRWNGDHGPFDLQGKILPFRDAYQTAAYTATLLASNEKAMQLLEDRVQQLNTQALKGSVDSAGKEKRLPQLLGLPRLFEIAQSGPYELPASIYTKKKPADVHPERDIRWWNGTRIAAALGIGFAFALLLAWISFVLRGHAHKWKRIPLANPNARKADVPRCFQLSASRRFLAVPSGAVFIAAALLAWFIVYLAAYLQRSDGEPFVWMEGLSIWPTETLRLLVFFMAAWFFFKTNGTLHENDDTILKSFGLRPLEISAARNRPLPSIQSHEIFQNFIRKRVLPYQCAPLFSQLRYRQTIGVLTVRNWRIEWKEKDREDRVIAHKLWRRYIHAGMLRVRIWRMLPLMICYIAGAFCLVIMLGFPPVPYRGPASFVLDCIFLGLAVTGSIFITFYIADVTILNRRLIDYLVQKKTVWPAAACDRLRQRWKVSEAQEQSASVGSGSSRPDIPPGKLLDEYLDIDLIATRTEVVGGLIYYPFVLITLMIVSRISLFDNWTWPVGLLIVIGGNGAYAAWSAWRLRRTAENARQIALKNLNDILIALTAEGKGPGAEAQTARETISMIKEEDRGAFAAISRHPLIGALLLPSGGAGIWALTQYLPGLF
jgi:hypothetical protein